MEQSEKKDIIVELNSDLSTVTLNGYRLSTPVEEEIVRILQKMTSDFCFLVLKPLSQAVCMKMEL